ncbi:unnamed protein product, partial [Phaeothamnion confervicola]
KQINGRGSNEKALIQVLCNRTKNQLHRIDRVYHKKYEKSLLQIVKNDVSGDFGRMMTHALLPSPDYGEMVLSAAFSGVGCNSSVLIDLAMIKNNAEILAIKKQYEAHNNKSLLDRLKSELSGSFETLMVKLYLGERAEAATVDEALATRQAKQLHDAGIGKHFGTDEKV